MSAQEPGVREGHATHFKAANPGACIRPRGASVERSALSPRCCVRAGPWRPHRRPHPSTCRSDGCKRRAVSGEGRRGRRPRSVRRPSGAPQVAAASSEVTDLRPDRQHALTKVPSRAARAAPGWRWVSSTRQHPRIAAVPAVLATRVRRGAQTARSNAGPGRRCSREASGVATRLDLEEGVPQRAGLLPPLPLPLVGAGVVVIGVAVAAAASTIPQPKAGE